MFVQLSLFSLLLCSTKSYLVNRVCVCVCVYMCVCVCVCVYAYTHTHISVHELKLRIWLHHDNEGEKWLYNSATEIISPWVVCTCHALHDTTAVKLVFLDCRHNLAAWAGHLPQLQVIVNYLSMLSWKTFVSFEMVYFCLILFLFN